MFVSFDIETLILRKMVGEKYFDGKQSINILHPSGENVFMVATHKKNVNYYEYPLCPF